MQTKLLTLFLLLYVTVAQASVPINDTIILNTKHVEGRWITEKKGEVQAEIYIFRDDNTFHKASDNGELLIFNIVGNYQLANDSIIISFQDYSRSMNPRVTKMYLQVIALSDEELNINKTEKNKTEFIRLKRQFSQ